MIAFNIYLQDSEGGLACTPNTTPTKSIIKILNLSVEIVWTQELDTSLGNFTLNDTQLHVPSPCVDWYRIELHSVVAVRMRIYDIMTTAENMSQVGRRYVTESSTDNLLALIFGWECSSAAVSIHPPFLVHTYVCMCSRLICTGPPYRQTPFYKMTRWLSQPHKKNKSSTMVWASCRTQRQRNNLQTSTEEALTNSTLGVLIYPTTRVMI